MLGDGGITTLGLTIVNLALRARRSSATRCCSRCAGCCPRRRAGSRSRAGSTAAVCVLLAAAIFVVEVTLGAAVAIDRTAVAVSTLGAYAVIARRSRATLTALIVRGLLAVRPDLVRVAAPLRRGARASGPRAARPVSAAMSGRVWFVGAGPGAADLLTLRAVRVLGEADVVVWARSLVDPAVLEHARPGAELVASDDKTFDDVRGDLPPRGGRGPRASRACTPATRRSTARCTSSSAPCRALGLACEIVPGVSSLAAAAAALGQELTVPDVSQSLILTRRAQRTSMPPNEDLRGDGRATARRWRCSCRCGGRASCRPTCSRAATRPTRRARSSTGRAGRTRS